MAGPSVLLHLEGHEIGGCRLIRRLGAGGMGEVYLAEQVRLGGREVAIKIVRANDETPGEFQDAARRFLHEGRLLAQFTHPNILPVHDSGVDGEYLYLVMEYAPDGSLKDAIRGRAPRPLPLPLDPAMVGDLIGQIAAALQYTHDRGVVHGDVKPGNVLVQTGPDGHRHLLLADFGVARDMEATVQWNMVTGTVAYMAPEQFSGIFSPATDQYALGVVAYQLLTGRTPFEGGFAEQMRGHLDTPPPPLRGLNPAVPQAVARVIARALAKHPEDRWPSVRAFADALAAAVLADDETTMRGLPGAWDVTRAARARHAESPRPPRSKRAMRGAAAAGHVPAEPRVFLMGGEPTVPQPAAQVGPLPGGNRRRPVLARAGVLAACAALLLVAVAAAIAIRSPGRTTADGVRGTTGNSVRMLPTPNKTPIPNPPTALPSPTATATSTPTIILPASSGDSFAVAGLAVPPSVAPGATFTATLTLRNTGSTAWSDAGGYRLTCDTVRTHPAHSNCPAGLSVPLGGYVVTPDSSITFTLTLVAPPTPGTYNAWVTMARGNAVFAANLVQITVRVSVPPAPQPTATPSPAPTDTPQPTAAPSSTATATPTPTPTATPTDTPTPAPSATDTPTPDADGAAPSAPSESSPLTEHATYTPSHVY